MKTRYVVFRYEYSPDFGLENPKAIKLYENFDSAQRFQIEETIKMWENIISIDKTYWIHGGHYSYNKPKLINLGYNENEMTSHQLRKLVERIAENSDLKSFEFCKIKTIIER